MADKTTTAKPDDKAQQPDTTPTPEEGVTIRSSDPADAAPDVTASETDEERATREAAAAGDGDDDETETETGDDAGEEDDAIATAADETETETEEERAAKAATGDDGAKPKRRRPRAQERINEALRERYRSDARAAALQQENEELKAAAAEKPKAVVDTGKEDGTPDESPPEPEQNKFETYEEFLTALTDWRLEKGLKAARADIRKDVLDEIKADRDREAADVQLQADQDAVATYQQRIDETRVAHPDFDEVIEKSGDVPISPPMREALIATPLAGDILYHFAKNPVLCAEIADMPASQALVAMGRLEQQLEVEAGGATGAQAVTATARPKRRLPKPVTPVGTSTAASTVPLDKLPYPEYKAAREKQERAAAGR